MKLRVVKSRRGVSLTEMLVLMSSCTMILTLCTVLLHRVMRVEIDSRAFVDAERTSERLGHQFRQDVHQATAAEMDASRLKNDVFLQLQFADDQTVEYRGVKGNVLRTVTHGGTVAGREEFAFEPSCKLAVHGDESPKRIALSIMSPTLESTTDKAEQLQSYKAVPVGLVRRSEPRSRCSFYEFNDRTGACEVTKRACVCRRSQSGAEKGERRGTVLVVAIVCLSVVMGILGSMLKGTLLAHRQLHGERDLRQTELLLQAGSDRAIYRLASDATYRGESWNVAADTIAEKGEGRVTIEIMPGDGQSARKAQVVAEYPLGGETSIRRSRTFQVPIQNPR